jgi:hypothetical protein
MRLVGEYELSILSPGCVLFAFSGVGAAIYGAAVYMCARAHSGTSKWGRVQILECIRAYNSKPTISWPSISRTGLASNRQNACGVGFLFLSQNSARFPSPTSRF